MRHLHLVLGSLVLSATCVAQAASWIQATPKNNPGPRWAHGNAHDFLRGRTIVFGGGSSSNKGDDTWEYDGNDWTQMNPSTKPPGRRLTAMSFHLSIVKTVMFGGSGISTSYLNDTWTWDGKTWAQVNTTNSPSGRWGHGMAYDSARGRTVLIGGLGSGLLNDTWEFDGKTWTQITTQSSPQTGIFGGSIAYDAARKVVVFFGGGPSSYLNDTWEYDGKTWTQQQTAVSPPARRDYDEMVYDVARKRIVIYGGTGNSGLLSDTWEYVGPQSLSGTPSTISIATGGKHSFALDAGTANANRLYWIFGSVTGTTPGVTLYSAQGAVTIPLIPDLYTNISIGLANSSLLTNTRSALDASGKGAAALNVPQINDQNAIGVKLYHAYLVYDALNNFYMASNPVTLTLIK